MCQENLSQFLEAQALVEQGGVLEAGVGCDRLEQLQEAGSLWGIEKFRDGPRACFMGQPTTCSFVLLPEAQSRAKNRTGAIGGHKANQIRMPLAVGLCDNRISRAKIYPPTARAVGRL